MVYIHHVNITNFNLNLLLALEAVLEERNISRAAKRIGLSQPATSSALRRLREQLADPLLVRAGRKMQLTARGEELLPKVAEALRHVREALAERPTFEPSVHAGSFNIVSSDFAELVLLPHLLKRIRMEAPGVVLRFSRMEKLFHVPVEDLASGNADLVLGFIEDSPAIQSSLAVEKLWDEENVVIVRRLHPTIRGPLKRAAFLQHQHAAVFYQHRQTTGLIDSILQRQNSRRNLVLTLPHFFSVCHAVSTSDLIAVVPKRLAEKFAKQLELRILPCPVPLPVFTFSMLWHQRSQTVPANMWLRSMVREAVRDAKH